MYKMTIGIEIHCELLTVSKMFATSSSMYTKNPNTHIDPISLAYPGTLPQVNRVAVVKAIQACHALELKIDKTLRFDRKCYFYHDNPKNYQVTQQHFPIGSGGFVKLENGNIGIERLHIEEDTAKTKYVDGKIYIDYNRSGNPLIEIVTKPEIKSAEHAAEYVNFIRENFKYLNISDAKLEEGSLRCDVNISVSKTEKLGTKVEVKNMNSVSNVKKAINYEFDRQVKILESGKEIEEETRRWDEEKQQSISMRKKDTTMDYIFLPDPNIPPIKLSDNFVKNAISEMKDPLVVVIEKLIKLGVEAKDASIITRECEYIRAMFEIDKKYAAKVSKLITGDISAYVNKENINLCTLNIKNLNELMKQIESGNISNKQSKDFVKNLFDDVDIKKVINESGTKQVSDNTLIESIFDKIIMDNEKMLEELETRPDRVIKFFMGQLMKETKGQANPQLSMKLLKEKLGVN